MMARWHNLTRFVAKAAGYSAAERRFALYAWLGAPVVEGLLATYGLGRTLQWLERTAPANGTTAEDAAAAPDKVGPTRGALLVDQAYRFHLLRGECLPRSLLQYWLHRRQGTPVRFIVGIRHAAGGDAGPQGALEAHAWVEGLASRAAPRPESGTFETLLVREAGSRGGGGGKQP